MDRSSPGAQGRDFADLELSGTEPAEPQSVPVNIFETAHELVIVAAMPGMEADNVEIVLEDQYLTIRAAQRGPGQERHRYFLREWSYGPYERAVELPVPVATSGATATYGNGLVTVAFPKAVRPQSGRIVLPLG